MLFFIEKNTKQLLIVFAEKNEVLVLAGVRVADPGRLSESLSAWGKTQHWSVLLPVEEPNILRFGLPRKVKVNTGVASVLGLNSPHLTLSAGDLCSGSFCNTSLVCHLLDNHSCQRLHLPASPDVQQLPPTV